MIMLHCVSCKMLQDDDGQEHCEYCYGDSLWECDVEDPVEYEEDTDILDMAQARMNGFFLDKIMGGK